MDKPKAKKQQATSEYEQVEIEGEFLVEQPENAYEEGEVCSTYADWD